MRRIGGRVHTEASDLDPEVRRRLNLPVMSEEDARGWAYRILGQMARLSRDERKAVLDECMSVEGHLPKQGPPKPSVLRRVWRFMTTDVGKVQL